MAFENIDVGKLRSALNECKSSLNYSTSKSLAGSIANSSIWQSSAQGNLKNALSKLIDERYKEQNMEKSFLLYYFEKRKE